MRFLAELPVSYLPLEPPAIERLRLLGLRRIVDLAMLPFAAVQAAFGPAGARAWRLANGRDDAPVVPRQVTSTAAARLRFDHGLASIDAILAALRTLLDRAFGDPAPHGHAARQAQLRALLSDGTTWERLMTFKEAASSQRAAYDAIKAKLQLPNALPPAPVEELSLELLGLGGERAKQGSLFSAPAKHWGQIVEATRQLHARYGHTTLYRATEVEPWSRVPERRWALLPYEP
jgi:DNA polymerase-4/protein ImuB